MRKNPDLVRLSCSNFRSTLVTIDEVALSSFSSSLNVEKILEFVFSTDGLSTNRFEKDIPFPSRKDEAGFLLVAHGLDFGSGFRQLLHKHRRGAGAWLTIRAGLINMGQQNPTCEATWLSSLTLHDVATLFDLECGGEELEPLAKQLQESIQEIGNQLTLSGFSCPGDFVVDKMKDGASGLVQSLVDTFPLTFCDEYVVNDQQVCFYKKAQLVVSEIYMRFAKEDPAFEYHDIDNLTAFVDNVVVAMMRMTGIIVCNEVLVATISEEREILKGSEEEVALRSSALHAVELIVHHLNSNTNAHSLIGDEDHVDSTGKVKVINSQKLCNWLWGWLGKDGANRNYHRHRTPSTSYY